MTDQTSRPAAPEPETPETDALLMQHISPNYHRPTCYLRFVERSVPAPELGENMWRTVRILQQLWVSEIFGRDEEWRDVPLGRA